MSDLQHSELGKRSAYTTQYDPSLLFAIPRQEKRAEIGIKGELPFYGVDIWNAYEVSWLNPKGKPQIAWLQFSIPAFSAYLLESKSIKLYLNSFNNTQFADHETVVQTIKQDFCQALQIDCLLDLQLSSDEADVNQTFSLATLPGTCLDELDIEVDTYQPAPELLCTSDEVVNEKVYSNLLKSNCLVTAQPDWGSVAIEYCGHKIDHAALLKYIISFRNHNEFHEQCIERIFMDIMRQCQPNYLSVYGRYTRRGGLDINPFRTTEENFATPKNIRLFRQ